MQEVSLFISLNYIITTFQSLSIVVYTERYDIGKRKRNLNSYIKHQNILIKELLHYAKKANTEFVDKFTLFSHS